MNNSKYYISLDVHKTVSQSSIPVKRGDNSLTICASLTENGKEYVIAEDCTVVFTAAKPDGKSLYNFCTVENNAITYVITAQTAAAEGQVECEFRLMNADGQLLTSPRFTLIVEDTMASDSVVTSSDEFTELARMIGEVDSAEEKAQEALETADEAVERAESTRGIYVGSGDMPEGYDVQIDPEGEALLLDNEMSDTSENVPKTKVVKAYVDDGCAHTLSSAKLYVADTIQEKVTDFGLGGAVSSDWENVDEIKKPGWYRFHYTSDDDRRIVINGESYITAYMHVAAYSASFVTQTLYIPLSGQKDFHVVRTFNVNNEDAPWGEWEFENPPMVFEVEYRTTERKNNKAIYTKITSYDANTIGDGEVDIEFDGVVDGVIDRARAWTSKYLLPRKAHDGTLYQLIDVTRNGTLEYMQGSGVTAQKLYMQLWYTKN